MNNSTTMLRSMVKQVIEQRLSEVDSTIQMKASTPQSTTSIPITIDKSMRVIGSFQKECLRSGKSNPPRGV